MHSNEVKSDVPQCFSVLFHGRVFAESVCLQDKWPFSRRRWQATQRWYWIDFWNVAERTVWCIRADMNHKNSIKKPLECLTAEYYFWWLIWVGHYGGAPVKSPPTKLLLVPSWIPQHSLSLSLLTVTLHVSSIELDWHGCWKWENMRGLTL